MFEAFLVLSIIWRLRRRVASRIQGLKPGKAFALLQQFVVNKFLLEFFYNTSKQLIAQENISFGCPSRLMSPQKVKNQYIWIHACAEMIIKEVNSYR